MQGYLIDITGLFIREVELAKGQAIPRSIVTTAPMAATGNLTPKWMGNRWELVDNENQPTTTPTPQPTEPQIPVLGMANLVLSDGDDNVITPYQNAQNKCMFTPKTLLKVSLDIVDSAGNVVDISIDNLKLVMQEQADDQPNGREEYLTVNIANGHVTGEFQFDDSRNYKITAERNNRGLDRYYTPELPPFYLAFDTLDWLS
jgi:hypothetical protein